MLNSSQGIAQTSWKRLTKPLLWTVGNGQLIQWDKMHCGLGCTVQQTCLISTCWHFSSLSVYPSHSATFAESKAVYVPSWKCNELNADVNLQHCCERPSALFSSLQRPSRTSVGSQRCPMCLLSGLLQHLCVCLLAWAETPRLTTQKSLCTSIHQQKEVKWQIYS